MVDAQVDVLIVGAGPAGSATACLLARAGLEVIVADRATFPRNKPCAEYMSPSTVDCLARLGVVARLKAQGAHPVAGTTVIGAGGASLTGLYSQTGHHRSQGLSVARTVLDATLVEEARHRGATVLERTRLVGLEYREGSVSGAVLRAGAGPGGNRRIQASVTVGADGLHSAIARAFGNRTHGWLRRWGLVAHMRGVQGLADRAELHLGSAGYAGLNPIGGGIANVALVVPHREVVRAKGDVAGFVDRTLKRFPQIRDRMHGASIVGDIQTAGPFAARSNRLVVDGGLLVGDAAEFFDPFTGDGIHSALRGAELASDAILGALRLGARVPARALRSYLLARRRAFAGKWMVERMIGYGMHAPRLFDHAVGRIGRKPPMAHTMIGVTGHVVPVTRVLNPSYLARMFL